jgi:hypothetical protein
MEEGELQNADVSTNVLMIGLLQLGKKSVDLVVETEYIQAFSNEDLFSVVQQAQSLA